MSISHRTEPNAVKRIARDPVSRRKFFALTGGTGAAGALARGMRIRRRDVDQLEHDVVRRAGHGFAVRRGRPRDRQLRADARVPRDRVLQRRRQERTVQGRRPGADQAHRRGRAGARRRAHRDGEEARRRRRRRPRRRSSRSRTPSRCSSSRRRSRTSAPPPTSARRRTSRSPEILAAALSIHSVEGRHAAALNVAGRRGADPGRRVRASRPTCRKSSTPSSRSSSSDDGPDRTERKPNNSNARTDANGAPELAKVEVENLNRSAFLIRGMLAAGAVYGTAAVGPLVPQGVRPGRRRATSTSSTSR